MLGAAWIADRAVLPAIAASSNATTVAIASRDPLRAQHIATTHSIPTVHASYSDVIDDANVDAVYIPLVNSLHMPWAVRALRAGKHVLCEKPLAMNAHETREMARVAHESGRLLMEALMYRFHPRMVELRSRARAVRHLHAAFSFTMHRAGDYRMVAELGGGALLDVGCYVLDVARWFCGTPSHLKAVGRGEPVDMSVAAALEFPDGAMATVWASFDAPEHQQLTLVSATATEHVDQPFTAWRDPHDPYQLMVEAFADAAITGAGSPLPLEESIATAELIDRVRDAFRPHSS